MKFIADFHVHSKYSRATAKSLDLENLYMAAQIKGITVVGTGDFTHPAWWAEIKEKLTPAEEGLFVLKEEIARACEAKVPSACRRPVRFMLVTEISNIYKKDGKTRKNHNLVFMPDFATAQQLIQRLDQIGNINSDGRPILGLDARNLLEIVLETSAGGYLIPAHIWTPWFSLLGSKSGFDTVSDCFADLTTHIFALETGLSSDPPMNWRVSDLDRFTLISNSDAHSPAKLGREANRFDTEMSYTAIRKALETKDPKQFLGTLEFFPEEGKYHVDGHRKCNFRSLPQETRALNGICPVCGKALTLGVLYRVEALADRPNGARPTKATAYENLIPLQDVLAEVFQCGRQSKRVEQTYQQLINRYGAEFDILRTISRDELAQSGVPLLAEAIERVRNNQIHFAPGYDGEFGQVRIFDPAERAPLQGQQSLFAMLPETKAPKVTAPSAAPAVSAANAPKAPQVTPMSKTARDFALNPEQQAAVDHSEGPLLIVAGPGTGKTRTITCRMAALMNKGLVDAAHILAVTFTNKAAQEMRHRLQPMLAAECRIPFVATFHGLCWRLLKEVYEESRSTIVDDADRRTLLADAVRQITATGRTVTLKPGKLLEYIVKAKQQLLGPEDDLSVIVPTTDCEQVAHVYHTYQALLALQNLFDFEDLILHTVHMLTQDADWRRQMRRRFTHIFVDEFQDINFGQYRLIRLLAPPESNLCVIGDPDQAIYGFRGSDVRYFQHVTQDYPRATIIRLSRNYRSTQAILASAFQVIQGQQTALHQTDRVRTYSNIAGFKTLSIVQAPSAKAEAVAIGQTIEQMVGGTGFHAVDFGKVAEGDGDRSFADFAVLSRTGDQGRQIADVLIQAGIPCQLVSNDDLGRDPTVIKLLATLRVMHDQGTYADLPHVADAIASGIGKETLACFKTWAYAKQLPLSTALHTVLRLPIPGLSLQRQQRLATLVRQLKEIKHAMDGMTVVEKLTGIVQQTALAAQAEDEKLRLLISRAAIFEGDVDDFLAVTALQSDTDLYQPEVEKVTLMTMHAAKGLEFAVVFVAGCEDDLIPFRRPGSTSVDLDEERRLFYVAMTRAQERLFFCWARKRTVYGRTSVRQLSPFVADIEQQLKESLGSRPKPHKKQQQEQLSLF